MRLVLENLAARRIVKKELKVTKVDTQRLRMKTQGRNVDGQKSEDRSRGVHSGQGKEGEEEQK